MTAGWLGLDRRGVPVWDVRSRLSNSFATRVKPRSAPPPSGVESRVITEVVFIVEEDPDGGLTAHAVGASIFTQGDTAEQLRENVRDAVRCHFADERTRPKVIRLHHVRDELLAA